MDLSNLSNSSKNGISIIIPVINEEANIQKLVDGLTELSAKNKFLNIREILFVDDGSTDRTREIVKSISAKVDFIDIVLKERNEKKGTVNAQLFGISQASFNNVIIMDGDLQHPVDVIPDLIGRYNDGYDMVIASRYVNGGKAERTVYHAIISRGANILAKALLPWVLPLRDPISGYFIVNKRIVPYSIEMVGFNKLALYILSCRKNISVAEVPFKFTERKNGYSKVANGGFSFMAKYVGELRYYRLIKKITRGRYRPSKDSSEYQFFRQD